MRTKFDSSHILSELAKLEELENGIVESTIEESRSCFPGYNSQQEHQISSDCTLVVETGTCKQEDCVDCTNATTTIMKRQMSTKEKCLWILGAMAILASGGGATIALLLYEGIKL